MLVQRVFEAGGRRVGVGPVEGGDGGDIAENRRLEDVDGGGGGKRNGGRRGMSYPERGKGSSRVVNHLGHREPVIPWRE